VNPTDALDVSSRVHLAKILSPEHAALVQATLVQRPSLPSYLIQTALPDDVVKQLELQTSSPLRPRFTVFPLPCGALLAVATVQAGGFQLCTAVPLVNPLSLAWLDCCIARGELGWLIEVPERRQAALVRTSCPFSNVDGLRAALARARMPSPEELVMNLDAACGWLIQPSNLDSCSPTVAVKQVHVAMVWRPILH
jgi:hypothetical protein